MVPEEKKTHEKYAHLTNEDIVKLLSKCRLMNFENPPEEFNGKDVPHGHDLMDLVVYRLKLADLADYNWIDQDKVEELNKHSA